jgi:type IV pilus biogenesis protein CpaD/CtpE
VLKATIASVLALSAAVSLAGCAKKPQEAAMPAATAQSPADTADRTMPPGVEHPDAKPSAEIDLAGIAKAEDGKTVAEVYAEKDALANTKVTVRGKVVKTNAGIMGKDWLHVRDGSGADGTNDLTVTTAPGTLPKVGDAVVVTGTVVLNKDFGMGYQYPVMLEGAEVKVE